nr:hypothetical protein [Rhodococcus wratislaviensis]GLK39208.1 hypothetical protein GCM10017611_60780 [Rhodococcus wratislaviensis]
MSEITDTGVVRAEVQVDGETASDLTVEQDGPAVLLLHGTYWSRVWLPVLGRLAKTGLGPIAVDLPGLGHSASCEIFRLRHAGDVLIRLVHTDDGYRRGVTS